MDIHERAAMEGLLLSKIVLALSGRALVDKIHFYKARQGLCCRSVPWRTAGGWMRRKRWRGRSVKEQLGDALRRMAGGDPPPPGGHALIH